MWVKDSDRDWELLAQLDPYWAVGTDATFSRPKMSDPARLALFLDTGRHYITSVWNIAASHLGAPFAPRTALDFGCGIGRLLVPLAERCEFVVGVDVADSMLAEARAVCATRSLHNVRFEKGDDALSRVGGAFDFVHSYIVLQHVAPKRGLGLIRQLLARVNDDGVGVIHVLYAKPPSVEPRMVRLLKTLCRPVKEGFRRAPVMQMNPYPLNEVFTIIQGAGIRQLHCLFTDHGGCLGVLLCFRKISGAPYLA